MGYFSLLALVILLVGTKVGNWHFPALLRSCDDGYFEAKNNTPRNALRMIYIVRFFGVAKLAMINNSPQENYEHEKQDCDRTRQTKTSWTVNQNEQAKRWIFIGYSNNAVFPARLPDYWGVILYTPNFLYGIIILWRQERQNPWSREVKWEDNYGIIYLRWPLKVSTTGVLPLLFCSFREMEMTGLINNKSFKYSMTICIVTENLIELQFHWQSLKNWFSEWIDTKIG